LFCCHALHRHCTACRAINRIHSIHQQRQSWPGNALFVSIEGGLLQRSSDDLHCFAWAAVKQASAAAGRVYALQRPCTQQLLAFDFSIMIITKVTQQFGEVKGTLSAAAAWQAQSAVAAACSLRLLQPTLAATASNTSSRYLA
jgi:hypothetical protein